MNRRDFTLATQGHKDKAQRLAEMSVTVPEGLSELLEEFAVTVLREKPTDLIEFAAGYFNNLYMSKKQGESSNTGGGVVSQADAAMPSVQAVSEMASTAEVEMVAEGKKLLIKPCLFVVCTFLFYGEWVSILCTLLL